jgi:hypothetical protein
LDRGAEICDISSAGDDVSRRSDADFSAVVHSLKCGERQGMQAEMLCESKLLRNIR